jgi:hypothetical protein
MLDEITLYWLTNSAASSARFYFEQSEVLGKYNNPGPVELPVGVSVFPHDLPAARSWAPGVYPRLFYWNELGRGGHFCVARGTRPVHGGIAPLLPNPARHVTTNQEDAQWRGDSASETLLPPRNVQAGNAQIDTDCALALLFVDGAGLQSWKKARLSAPPRATRWGGLWRSGSVRSPAIRLPQVG